MAEYQSLVELIESRRHEEQKGITFILSDTEEIYISYRDLYHTSLRLLYHFQQAGYREGDEVIFQIDDNERFVYSFWACILGGLIPIPVSTGNNDDHKLKLFKIWNILRQPKIIAAADFLEKLDVYGQKNGFREEMKSIRENVVCIEDAIQTKDEGIIYRPRPDDMAFIQFSSGSTGDPKGVIITHSNVLVDLGSVLKWDFIDSHDIGLNWMPLTHDMGLIGTHIKAILANMNQYNIHTQLFIRHPSLWIKKASEHKATILYSPNFGYKHFLKFFNPDHDNRWDLSSIRLIYNGAEPISLDLCNEFLDKMSVYGLKRRAMHPVYGLAEGTIAVTFPQTGEELTYHTLDRNHLKIGERVVATDKEDKNAVNFVDEGYPIFNCHIRICDQGNNDLGEDRIGYIQIRGGNVTSGFYNNPIATGQTIDSEGWLNTEDLGFIRNGRIVVTGRAKDVIFIAGQNYYAHDIERNCECVAGIELGKIGAVGVFNEEFQSDELILFVLHKQKLESFMDTVLSLKRVVAQKMGIEVSEVIPVKSIPKTTSGKVQRYKLRENYLNGEYESLKSTLNELITAMHSQREIVPATNFIEEELVRIWAEILNIPNIGIRDDFFELGGDSLRITQLLSRVRESFQVDLNQVELFQNPTVAGLASLIEKSTQGHQEKQDPIQATQEGNQKWPLSFAQKRLWFLDRLHLKSPQYNLYTGLTLKGNLNQEVLVESFNEIVQRHRILQVSFHEENGEPFQIVNPEVKMPFADSDLRTVPENERMTKVMELARDEARRPFNLEEAPLLRGRLIRLDENEHLLVLVVHHIVFDGWSFSILLKEFNYYYEARLKGCKQGLPDLAIQYGDFAQWQKETAAAGHLKKQTAYWQNQLGRERPVLDLPVDKQRPAIQTYNGARFVSSVPVELAKQLQTLAGKKGATLYMVLLAAFNILLYRYTGQTDMMIGSPVANRNRRETEGLIGFFTNNLVLRTKFSNQTTFEELLREVRETTLEAYSNQDLPFEKLVEELHIERDMSRNPLFQIFFGLQNIPLPDMDFSELNVSQMDIDAGYARFDLALDIREAGAGLVMHFEYNSDLFHKDTIIRMAGHYKQLLSGIVNGPGRTADEYEILTEEERKTIIQDWNDTEEDTGTFGNWVELFETQATKTPEAVAVVCGSQQLSYRELDVRSNQLAEYLIAKAVGSESIVGIYMDRSIDMVVGLVGIHKAGAAYLPMDPIFPRERLAYMIDDAKVGMILSKGKLAATLPDCNAEIICLDTEWSAIGRLSAERPLRPEDARNLAYLIYTSGSTGKPKGVQIEQRALINFLTSMVKKTQIGDHDALLAVTTLSFDIAGLELYLPLICGAKVVIAENDDVADGRGLIELLNAQKITFMQATPSTWRLLIEAGWYGTENLKVLCGGEALPGELAQELLARCAVLFNVYGPTETTIWSTLSRVESASGAVLIGKPIANTRVFVVDKAMNPVPPGVPGELLIGGLGLARGYLHLPKLSAERFIADPFTKKEGVRLYRTGDRVKFTFEGNLEFLGRMDNQVKIRGFRIELGEIEAWLNQNPAVKESVVVAKEISGEKALVAYMVPSSPKERQVLSPEYLRKSLKEKLPDYMVPTAFMVMDSFPMTPNGKVDRKALPIPDKFRPQLTTEYSAPATEIEKTVRAIWQEVLKLDRLGADDNFFDLGGHSLLLAQVRSKIGQTLHKEVSMMELFEYPTIRTLSKFLAGESGLSFGKDRGRNDTVQSNNGDVAIIGLCGRFPGAGNVDEFWRNLCNGVESISYFTDEQIISEGIDAQIIQKPGYVKAWGVLDDVDIFDARFFGYNPREAETLDPQQRIFLEECWKALENAGYDGTKYRGLVGVYASVGMNTYVQNLKDANFAGELAGEYQIMISNDKDFLATRIAYKLNLEGPAITVQTACSSSLVAVHLACQSLNRKECDMALAGGVSIRLPQRTGYQYQEGMILSPDGHCRAFDERANGTVGGNGVGVVVLKRLEDAMEEGDNIWAVIKGSAINNDGSLKIGYTAPRAEGQAKVIAAAQAKANVSPETISYIETHGTGTPLGDPIEMEALTKVFRNSKVKNGSCAIGSVKTNIGHLDAAAGVTALIKTALALRNKKLPPSLNFHRPNPKINFEDSPFFVNDALREWKSDVTVLRAGVSSFGIGGTNAHLILEEAPATQSGWGDISPVLLIFSAKGQKALDKMLGDFAAFLRKNAELSLADIAYTLQMGRKEFEYRRCFIGSSIQEVIQALEHGGDEPKRLHESMETLPSPNRQAVIGNPQDYSLEELGVSWLKGATIDWEKLYQGQRRKRLALPTYPFDGRRYWAEKVTQATPLRPAPQMEKHTDINRWFYSPVWKQSLADLHPDRENSRQTLLVLTDQNYFADRLIGKLRELNVLLVVAKAADHYELSSSDTYRLNMADPVHYENLIGDLFHRGITPAIIVNLLGIAESEPGTPAEKRLKEGERLFYSLVDLARAFGRQEKVFPVQIKVITGQAQKIFNETALSPEKTLHIGACRVIPREYPHIRCYSIDCIPSELNGPRGLEFLDLLAAEILTSSNEDLVAYRGLERWYRDYEPIELDHKNNTAVPLKNRGVYVIAGGMGGIGLVMAEYLAKAARAKLVLVGRSEFPEQGQWEGWLESHSKNDAISRKIMFLKKIRELGGEIMIYRADVSEARQMEALRDKIIEEYGTVNGVIHAAGVPGGGMIQLKGREKAAVVLTPKVGGALALYEAFKKCRLDFMIFCSSLNAITGGFGQSDYSAANIFLDAFAGAHDSHGDTRFISIDWDRWPGVGMAAGPGNERDRQQLHPLLGKCIEERPELIIYVNELRPDRDWVLAEHRVFGVPTVPGTTYLEMARAAWEDISGCAHAEISEVLFLNPLVVEEGQKRFLYTLINKNGEGFHFRILSNGPGGALDGAGWLEHVRGQMIPCEEDGGENRDIQELKKRCASRVVYSGETQLSEEFISFGRRWRSLRHFSLGDHEGLVELEIAKEFLPDLERCKLHPALMDVATGAVRLAAGGDYLPFGYQKLKVRAPLSGQIYGHIKFTSGYESLPEVITSDIDILDQEGGLLVEIKNFAMKIVGESAAANIKSGAVTRLQEEEYGFLIKLTAETANSISGILPEGISPGEGEEAFRRILKGCHRSQIIVSTKDIQSAIKAADYADQPMIKAKLQEGALPRERHPRPDLESQYVPPKTEAEKKLVGLWQSVLGIDGVGIQDDFFELGGDSLLLIQLHTKIKEAFQSDIAVVDLYKYNTIALLAKYLSKSEQPDEQPAFEAVNSRVNKQLERMKQRRQQLSRKKGAV